MRSKIDRMRDRLAFLEQEVCQLKGLSNNSGNLFYDLPCELQHKILFMNVIYELPSNWFLARKKKFINELTIRYYHRVSITLLYGNIMLFIKKEQNNALTIYRLHIAHLHNLNILEPRYSHEWRRLELKSCHVVHKDDYYMDNFYIEMIDHNKWTPYLSNVKKSNYNDPVWWCYLIRSNRLSPKNISNMVIQDHVNNLTKFLVSKEIALDRLRQSCKDNEIDYRQYRFWRTQEQLKKGLMAI